MIGTKLGPWVIDLALGQGGMGNVYRAHHHEHPERLSAIKILPASMNQEAGFVTRFEREIATLAQLKHENIVALMEAGQFRGQPYYVMEYVEGVSLAELLEQRGSLPWEEITKIGIQICKALQHAHQLEIVHRDIKPANLLLTSDGLIKLADFGIAKVFGSGSITAMDTMIGTADYVSPEQAVGKPITRRSDLYSLGIVLYQLLTGRLPFLAESAEEMLRLHRFGKFDPPSMFVSDLPHEMDELIQQLLEKDPEKRPSSAGVVADWLGRLQRKMVRKRQYTSDALRGGVTKIMGAEAEEQAQQKVQAHSPSPRNQSDSISFPRLILLSALFIMMIAILVYGLQPPSAADILQKADRYIKEHAWTDAESQLQKLKSKYPDQAESESVKQLESKIHQGRSFQQLRREAGLFAFSAPQGEAEKFYRRGVIEFFSGNREQAKHTWQLLIDSFDGVKDQATWVELAKQALKDLDQNQPAHRTLKDMIHQIKAGPPDMARKRLQALRHLYQTESQSQEALQLIDQAIQSLGP